MTVQECLSITDEMKPNMMSRMLKVKYITEIEQLIHREIVMKHYPEGFVPPQERHDPDTDPLGVWPAPWPPRPQPQPAPAYSESSDPGTVLVIPDPYSMVYVYWLMTKIDMQNQEDARYNIDRAHFENAYDTMSDWYTREHMPVQRHREFHL